MAEQPGEPLGSQGDDGMAGEVETDTREEPDRSEATSDAVEPRGRSGTNLTRTAILLGIALLVLAFTIVRLVGYYDAPNAGDFQPGDILHFVTTEAPFGTVIEFDEAHQFAAGPPTSAFLVRLAASDSEVWIGRDFAGKALYKASSEPLDQPSKTDESAGETTDEAE